jgi:hypothetical protein
MPAALIETIAPVRRIRRIETGRQVKLIMKAMKAMKIMKIMKITRQQRLEGLRRSGFESPGAPRRVTRRLKRPEGLRGLAVKDGAGAAPRAGDLEGGKSL